MNNIYAYIDGFNFYHGMTNHTEYRWCNLVKLCELLLPIGNIEEVKLFAAYAKEFPDIPGKPLRQGRYLSALKTEPKFKFIKSKFTREPKYLPVANTIKSTPRFECVMVNKEKGADVNLATHLLSDGINDFYDVALVITNDSDLFEPIRVARYDLGKILYLYFPCRGEDRVPCTKLREVSNYNKQITIEHIKQCQFPRVIQRNGKKPVIKPEEW